MQPAVKFERQKIPPQIRIATGMEDSTNVDIYVKPSEGVFMRVYPTGSPVPDLENVVDLDSRILNVGLSIVKDRINKALSVTYAVPLTIREVQDSVFEYKSPDSNQEKRVFYDTLVELTTRYGESS